MIRFELSDGRELTRSDAWATFALPIGPFDPLEARQ
jgi:hypothetical protein